MKPGPGGPEVGTPAGAEARDEGKIPSRAHAASE
jgi:hypothetical protein